MSVQTPPRIFLTVFSDTFRLMLPAASDLLRQFPGTRVTSWWRSGNDNAAVGGAPLSQHLVGLAFDAVPPRGVSWEDFAAAARQLGFEAVVERSQRTKLSTHVHLQAFGAGFLAGLGVRPEDIPAF